jgi:hypothetical protein
MKKARWITAAAGTAVLAAGFVLPGATAAYADTNPNGNGNGGLLSILGGNTANAPVSVPVNVCGLAVSLLGGSNSRCEGGADSSTTVNGSGQSGNGNGGVASVGSGNTVNAPVSVPVNVCGVSAAVGGAANAGCKGGSASTTTVGTPGHHHCPPPGGGTPPPGGGTPPVNGGTPPFNGGPPPGNGGTPHSGTQPGGTVGETTTVAAESLPITGANIAGMLIAALGSLGLGGVSLVTARRRRQTGKPA